MRVARLIERLPPASGGKEVHGAELTRALGELGVEQHVFCRVGDQLAGDIGQSVVRPGLARRAHTLLTWCAAAARAIEGAHAGDPFDLIHAHGDFLEATAAAVAARRLSIPAVLTVHGGLSDVPWHDELRLLSYSAMEQVIAVSQSIAERIRMIGISSDGRAWPVSRNRTRNGWLTDSPPRPRSCSRRLSSTASMRARPPPCSKRAPSACQSSQPGPEASRSSSATAAAGSSSSQATRPGWRPRSATLSQTRLSPPNTENVCARRSSQGRGPPSPPRRSDSTKEPSRGAAGAPPCSPFHGSTSAEPRSLCSASPEV